MADGHGGGGSLLRPHMMPAAKPTTPRWLTPALLLVAVGVGVARRISRNSVIRAIFSKRFLEASSDLSH
ncbi:MAG: hypothetical protein L0387_10010 [Acidobacteria bacterium]|nr:hypothetical protein [Acidobacteriota bacterium]